MARATPVTAHRLVGTLAAALRHRCGVAAGAGAHVLVACSGGADSVALLRLLDRLRAARRWRLTLTVAHVHHHARGADADADAAFVAALADQLHLPFLRRDLPPPPPPDAPGNRAGRWRRLRYAALADAAAHCHATHVATAHHADDQLETLLLRLVRGAGIAGLRGIAWRRPLRIGKTRPSRGASCELIRPLLGATHADLLGYLRQLQQPHREDATNADATRRRNRLRRDVLPVLRELRPNVAAAAVTTADHARAAHAVLAAAARAARGQLQPTADGYTLPRAAARSLPSPLLAGALRWALRRTGVPRDRLTAAALRPLLRAARDPTGSTRLFTLRHATVTVTRDAIHIAPAIEQPATQRANI